MSSPSLLLQVWGKMLYSPIPTFLMPKYSRKIDSNRKHGEMGMQGRKVSTGGPCLPMSTCTPTNTAKVNMSMYTMTATMVPGTVITPREKWSSICPVSPSLRHRDHYWPGAPILQLSQSTL